ncbi:MAG: CHRD domain-containing protein [Akkermansiaceae bacterium]|nr:CHRD domain-containing protein [Verrucomicrobiales bacterium]
MKPLLLKTLAITTVTLLSLSSWAQSSMIWSINSNGAKEVTAGGVPNQGDPDGTATGTLELNNGTGGNTGSAIINLTLSNVGSVGVAPNYVLGGWHIHQAAATTTGPIVLDFGQINTYLSGNTVTATINNLSSATINSVFANSAGFYLNIHGSGGTYNGGAIRDQLTVLVPEPGTGALLAFGLASGFFFLKRKE